MTELASAQSAFVSDLVRSRRIPGATYRLQFNATFTFQQARALVPYLHDLGITDLYASPLFKARTGSAHGYDVVDYQQMNPDLGSEADFDALVETLQAHGMGLLLDIVPNHMGIGKENRWWMDVLEHGEESAYADFFDINWNPQRTALMGKVLLPILGDHYGVVLENGELKLAYEGDHFVLHYFDTPLPVNVNSWDVILKVICEALARGDAPRPIADELYSLANMQIDSDDGDNDALRRVLIHRLNVLYSQHDEVRRAFDASIELINGTVGDSHSFDILDHIIGMQPYRLAYWRVATDEINYRRFFDINEMAAVQVENPQVFDAVHQLVLRLLAQGKVTGLRVDHPDGLWDPPEYFAQLQMAYVRARASQLASIDPLKVAAVDATVDEIGATIRRTDTTTADYPLYVVVEKILSETEPLPSDWSVYGTTGYDFMNEVNGLFVALSNESTFTEIYARFIGRELDFRELIYDNKHLIMDISLASEIYTRGQMLARLVERNRRLRGYTLNSINLALREIIAGLGIYRTYISSPATISDRDRSYVEAAVRGAKARYPRVPAAVFDFVGSVLLLQNLYEFDENQRRHVINFVMQFQQITGPVMAKSVEDTVFYIYNRLTSLNEVGGSPEQFGVSVAQFHQHNRDRAEHWRHTLLGLSTHDTKRSGDVRARINVLSEMPAEWESAIQRWSALNSPYKIDVNGELAPDANEEYLLYQTLIGVWTNDALHNRQPFIERLQNYMQKAINEAKVHTRWTNANQAYQDAVRDFTARVLNNAAFIEDFRSFHVHIDHVGRWNSLAQTLLELTSPGVPDTYQGTELWDYSLVDPDNRRPIDYAQRETSQRDLLARQQADALQLARELVEASHDGRIKQSVIAQTLRFRRDHAALFSDGSYLPLEVRGSKADHVCAFARVHGDSIAIVAVPVLIHTLMNGSDHAPLGDVWADTAIVLPDGAAQSLTNIFTGETMRLETNTVPMASLCGSFPVALCHIE